jgi:hypothetical protein
MEGKGRTGITEKKELVRGVVFTKRHHARSLRAARGYAKKLRAMGYPQVHIEKEMPGHFNIYTHGRATKRGGK